MGNMEKNNHKMNLNSDDWRDHTHTHTLTKPSHTAVIWVIHMVIRMHKCINTLDEKHDENYQRHP